MTLAARQKCQPSRDEPHRRVHEPRSYQPTAIRI